MSDYKHTVHLPQTKFPMKASLAQREPEMLAFWEQIQLYAKMRQKGQGKPKYVLHDGPPYANGHLHIGHAVNKILKDIIVKSKTLSGFDAPYVPGWDCHGLPIELNVEKKRGKPTDADSAKKFREACRQYAHEQKDIQKAEFKRMGVIGDWENPYLTMSPQFEAMTMRALGKIAEKGHIHQGRKPVHWCIDCGSALAEAEVEYQDKNSHAIDVRFPILSEETLFARCNHTDNKGQGPLSIAIWTTTPWTLPANQAVALNPELDYVVVQCESDGHHERLLVADGLLKDVMFRYGIEQYHVIAYCKGDALEGLKLQHPFYDREVPIILGDHVNLEAGTGAVHTAPGHGQEDYVAGQRYQLHVDNPVDGKGCFISSTPLLAGLHIYKANDTIIEILKSKGNLLQHKQLKHSYPHCWRHKTPLIFRATPQWFISMDQQKLREIALDAIAKTEWLPDWGRARITSMVENRPDWCISRQRTWGVPIPFFVHKETGQLHPDTPSLVETIARRADDEGIEAWYQLDPKELLGEQAADYHKVMDILDVWFDSGSTFAAVLKQRDDLHYPAELYLEGSDQHRGWFQSSLLIACAIDGHAPFKSVLTHGFTVDGNGMKMSKSIGNVISSEQFCKTQGADILRLWIASTDYRGEISYSDEIFNRNGDSYRRIRNTARYLLANLHDFDPKQHRLDEFEMLELDQYILVKAAEIQQEILAHYERFDFHLVCQAIHHFCSIELGSFYLDVIKDRQYTSAQNSRARRSAQTAMFHILHALARWLAPILSFTAEEIWQHLPHAEEESIFLTEWYAIPTFANFSNPQKQGWNQILAVRNEVNKALEKARNEGKIGSGLEAAIVLYVSEPLLQQLQPYTDELHFVFITSKAQLLPESQKTTESYSSELSGLAIAIQALTDTKCERCWHRRPDVGQNSEHPSLCQRCITNITEPKGETRLYA